MSTLPPSHPAASLAASALIATGRKPLTVLLLVEHRLEREALSALIDREPAMRAAAASSLPFALRLLAERGAGRFVALVDAGLLTSPARNVLLESGPEKVLLLRDPQEPGPRTPENSPRIASVCRDTPWYSVRKALLANSPDLVAPGRSESGAGPRRDAGSVAPVAVRPADAPGVEPTAAGIPPSEDDDRKLASLTRRERQVLELIAGGGSVKEGAESLHIAVSTFDNHKSRLMKKVGVRKSSELIRFAFRLGLAP